MRKDKLPQTERDLEMAVLASMMSPETGQAAREAIRAARFDPAAMFTDPDARDCLDVFIQHGADAFGGRIGGRAVAELATHDIGRHIAAIAANWRRKMETSDRTLDAFETPGPDAEDPDCLFQNRWLRRGMCGAVISTSGVGKSTFTMQAATVWAGGEECLGIRPLKPLKIGIFQSEDDEYDIANFRDRIRIGLAAEMGWPAERIREAESRVTFCALDGSTGARFIEHLRRKQERHRFDLIVINPLFAFFGGDLNDTAEVSAFLRHGIDPLIKAEATRCGCLIVHHTGKPSKERLAMGEVFSAYVGNGSSEFTNYVRTALVITPHGDGRTPGLFTLIAAKHGDKLGWRDAANRPTVQKTVCYANRLPEYSGGENAGIVFWTEPDEVQAEALKRNAAAVVPSAARAAVPPLERCARALAQLIADSWTEEGRPANANDGQRYWVTRSVGARMADGASRSTREAAYNLLVSDPTRFGLREVRVRGGSFLVAADGLADPETEAML